MKITKFLKKSPVVPLVFCGMALERRLLDSFRRHDLNLNDALVLVSVFFEEHPCRPSEMADSLGVSRSQISQSIKRLREQGLLERSLEMKDARFLNLRLTSSGRTKVQKVIRIFDQLTNSVEKILGVKESEAMASKTDMMARWLRQNTESAN